LSAHATRIRNARLAVAQAVAGVDAKFDFHGRGRNGKKMGGKKMMEFLPKLRG
jgi:hypothetical protein